MSVPRFEIQLENSQTFQPGDDVTGHILLDLTGCRKSRGLVLCCRGGAYVQINPNSRKLRHMEIAENREVYVTHDSFVAGTGREIMLFQPGSYTFEFSIRLPLKIPNTIHTSYGYVRYAVLCKFDETPVPDVLQGSYLDIQEIKSEMIGSDVAVKNIVVFQSYNISHVPGISDSRYEQAFERVGQLCCGAGEVSFLFSLPKTGYCIGENMFVMADIRNMSKRLVLYSEVAINQVITFKAGGHEERVQKRICSTKRGNIPPQASYVWSNVPVFVPAICQVTTQHCNIIQLTYKATFTVGVQTKLRVKRVQVEIPLVIGVK